MDKVRINFDVGQPLIYANVKRLSGIVGLYFIYNNNISLKYPYGSSKLIYIGMSEKKTNSMGKRLQDHLEGKSGNEGIVNYGKANPISFTYINFEMIKNAWPSNIESLEAYFITSFLDTYGVYPICNNKSGYSSSELESENVFDIGWEAFET